MSFTASAGHAPDRPGGSFHRRLWAKARAVDGPAPSLAGGVRLASRADDWMLARQTPTLGRVRRFAGLSGEMAPRDDLKSVAGVFPAVDRRLKGDPILPLRPGLSRARPPVETSAPAPFGGERLTPAQRLASGDAGADAPAGSAR